MPDNPALGCGTSQEQFRTAAWLDVLLSLHRHPALPAAAIAWHAWHTIAPFQYGGGGIGRLLVPAFLSQQGKISAPILCLSVGLRELRWLHRDHRPLSEWIHDFCGAVRLAADRGLETHRRLTLARSMMARHLEGRRRSSRFPALAELALHYPLLSAPMVAKELRITQQGAAGLLEALVQTGAVQELTGRSRYRAYGDAALQHPGADRCWPAPDKEDDTGQPCRAGCQR